MTSSTLERAGAPVEAVVPADAFVFRRIATGVYAHLGGRGRGEGWAGIVRIELDEDPLVADAVARHHTVRLEAPRPTRLFGPYWAREAAVVPLSHDELVVLGGPGTAGLGDERCEELAQGVSDEVGEVTPAKRLADELELLHAVEAVALTPLTHLDVVAQAVLAKAAAALSCEIAVLHLPSSSVTVVVDAGAPQPMSTQEAVELVTVLGRRVGDSTHCFQELRAHDRVGLPPSAAQLLSLLCIPLDVEAGAVMVLAHTTNGPRGFTDLCRDIGGRVAHAARTVLMAAMQHDQLRRRAEDADERATTDELTGLRNRRGWEQAIDAVPSGARSISVVLADGNGLKCVNDEHGHAVGDEHLRTWAQALRAVVRDGDVVARIGGDEFGILLVDATPARCATIVDGVRAALCAGPLDTSLAIGSATGDPGAFDALLREADAAMYVDKGSRSRC